MNLVAEGISIQFGGLQALRDVSLTIEPGSVVALIGPNGAGKTTFINCLSGFVKPNAGTLSVGGSADLFGLDVRRRVEAGIGRSFQSPRVDPDATLGDNLKVGFYRRTRSRLGATVLGFPYHRREEREIASLTSELLARFGLSDFAEVKASDASVWRLRLLEVARAIALDARYLMLDEPAAGLDESARQLLVEHIRALREEGYGVLLVEHNFGFVRAVSDHVIVLHQGENFAHGSPGEIASNERVIDVYLGSSDDRQF